MRYQCFFVNDTGVAEHLGAGDFDTEEQARFWARSLADHSEWPGIVELWGKPYPVERYVAMGARPGLLAAFRLFAERWLHRGARTKVIAAPSRQRRPQCR
jgi:hypothetical protein